MAVPGPGWLSCMGPRAGGGLDNTYEGWARGGGRGANDGIAGVGRAATGVLGTTGEHWTGVDTGSLSIAGAGGPGAMEELHSKCGAKHGVRGSLVEGTIVPNAGVRVRIGETGPANLGGPRAGETRGADTPGNLTVDKADSRLEPPAGNGEPRGAETTPGGPAVNPAGLRAGVPGDRTGDTQGMVGLGGVAKPGPLGGAPAAVMVVVLLVVGGGAGLEMMRTWLPGPRP